MLRDEDRVISHRRLLAIVLRLGGSQARRDEVGGVAEDLLHPTVTQVGAFFLVQSESAAK